MLKAHNKYNLSTILAKVKKIISIFWYFDSIEESDSILLRSFQLLYTRSLKIDLLNK